MKRLALALVLLGLVRPAVAAPLFDSVSLNIGLNCQWQARCIAQQRKAMKRALTYVSKKRPAAWRIHLCNRNAARKRYRVDWVGFDNCIRNATLRTAPRAMMLKRGRKIA